MATIVEHKLLRDLLVALVVKTVALALLWTMFVRDSRPSVDTRALLPGPLPSQNGATH